MITMSPYQGVLVLFLGLNKRAVFGLPSRAFDVY